MQTLQGPSRSVCISRIGNETEKKKFFIHIRTFNKSESSFLDMSSILPCILEGVQEVKLVESCLFSERLRMYFTGDATE